MPQKHVRLHFFWYGIHYLFTGQFSSTIFAVVHSRFGRCWNKRWRNKNYKWLAWHMHNSITSNLEVTPDACATHSLRDKCIIPHHFHSQVWRCIFHECAAFLYRLSWNFLFFTGHFRQTRLLVLLFLWNFAFVSDLMSPSRQPTFSLGSSVNIAIKPSRMSIF